jgi:hypothetical protein
VWLLVGAIVLLNEDSLVFVNGIAGSRIEGSDMRNQNGGSAIARFLCEQLPNAQLVTFDLVEGLNGTRAWVNALDIGQRALKLLQRLNQKRLVGTTEDDGYHEKNVCVARESARLIRF